VAVDAPTSEKVDTPERADIDPKPTLEETYAQVAEAAGVDLDEAGDDTPAEAGADGDASVVKTPDGAAALDGDGDEEPGAEVPAFELPDDPGDRAKTLAAIKNHPDVQTWQSDAIAKAANTATEKVRGEEREKATAELNALLEQGDPRAKAVVESAEQKSAGEMVALGRAANTIWDATLNTLVEKFELDKGALSASSEVPDLIAKALEGLDAKRATEFDAKVDAGIAAGIRKLRDKERGGRPSPSRDAALRSNSPPRAQGGSLEDYYAEAEAAEERKG